MIRLPFFSPVIAVNFRLSSDEVTVGEADGTVTLTIFKSGDTVLTTSTEVLVSSDSAIGKFVD